MTTPETTALWNEWLKTDDGKGYQAGWGDFANQLHAARGQLWVAERIIERRTAERDRLGEALEAAITAGAHILGDYRASHGCISSNWEDRDGFLSRAGIEDPNPRKATR